MSKGLPRVAAVTMVRNEGRMIHKWVDYYGAQLGVDSLVVVDDNSDDGSTDALGCRVERIAPITGDFEPARMKIVNEVGRRLLRKHDAVIFADADEFIVPDPARYDDLRGFAAARLDRQAVGVMCLNVVHHVATEEALDFTRPVLAQRSLVKFIPLFCKPALKFVANPWAAASHGLAGASFAVDPELFMFHLKFADRDHLAEIAAHRRSMVELDGRASLTSWQFTSDEMLDLLDRLNEEVGPDPAAVDEFAPSPDRLAEIATTFPNGLTRATGARMVPAMERRPFKRIPARFAQAV
ncbi:MAG: glycosyltransferase family 2 protein [Nocardioides sp.]|uniref:glycosyltransferase family 2 protein n=1 Tax=Nocardioides sp. TaxID=35761 RepID=UPI0039E67F68